MTDDSGSLPMRSALVAVGVLAVALAAAVATGALPASTLDGDAQPDGEELLDRVGERYESAETLSGEATVTAANATAERSVTVSFVVDRPNRTKLSTTRDGSEYAVGTNGSVAWVYDGANDTARVWDLPDNASAWNESATAADGAAFAGNGTVPSGNWSDAGNHSHDWNGSHAWNGSYAEAGNHTWNGTSWADPNRSANVTAWLAENVTAEVRETTTLDGAEVYVVGVEPTNESYRGEATLWVDTDDYRVHQLRASYGENSTTVTFDGLQFNASVHESTFRPPDAASVNAVGQERYDNFDAAQAGTDVTLQRLDTEGYAFDEAVVVTRAGRTVAAQSYTGAANVTVVATADDLPSLNASAGENATESESVTVAGADGTYVGRDDGSAVVWADDGVTRAVVGDLPREELVDLAERVAT
ncbi:outer membrane lipoprotein-sorting protein [Halosimplex pelagicum]|uniref:DUF4367 domain-containing protein n=1 Tax=Halosimplex pelagicum TaxID=869886 RepID=A0A7D5P4E1_9EURY|nr:DUF4367 domain-containing protein [Halosimplex pelagicum]QLH80623.1 DUF4367 domain-containing protein [Halosimplex pelagicum]